VSLATESHSVTFHLAQVNTPRLEPSHHTGYAGTRFTSLEGWKAELSWARWPVAPHTRFTRWMQNSARRPPTLWPSPRTWAIGQPVGS